jgi:hypothetical protein
METAESALPAVPKWWQWQPRTRAETALYLLAMALLSGVLSIVLNGLFGGEDHQWGHFVGGALISLPINGLTLWIKRHPRHPHHT